MDIHSLRKEYRLKQLRRQSLDKNPFLQFKVWWEEARQAEVVEPNAFALATADRQGRPSCRMVLLKYFGEEGMLFFTNLESRKAKELSENPVASALFWWKELERQVIIEGHVEMTSSDQTTAYFAKRPRKSQLGAWASHQDAIISSRLILEENFRKREKQFEGKEIPLPPYWGGFKLIPVQFEFWQGREDRLHDRFKYITKGNSWNLERVSP